MSGSAQASALSALSVRAEPRREFAYPAPMRAFTRGQLLLSTLAFGLLACARPSPPAPAAPLASASSASPAEVTPTPAEPPGMNALALPSPAVCVLSAAKWETAYPEMFIELGTTGAPNFAQVRAGRAQLTIGAGGETYLEVATPRVALRGYPATTQLLHTRRAVVFGGWLVNLPRTPLTLASSDRLVEGKIPVDGPTPPHVRTLARAGEKAVVACDELALVPEPFEVAAALPAARPLLRGYLPTRDVPLSLTPGGAPVATLRGPAGGRPVEVVEERGPRVRIVWNDDDQAVVFGWIERAALSPTAPARPVATPTDAVEPPAAAPAAWPGEAELCPNPVRLLEGGRFGAKRFPIHLVGTIAPGTPIGVLAREDTPGTVAIRLGDEAGVRFPEGALLLVPAADLARCRRR